MQPTYIIAPPNPGKIIGRVDLLAKIHSELQSGQPVALVHGIGGIGKTTAAAAYAHHPEYSHGYDAICWLEVVQDLPRAFASAVPLHRFLEVDELVTQTLLNPQHDPETPREVYALMHIVDALRKCQKRLLLLLDNANEEQELRRFIPVLKEAPYLRILVTSRADCDDLNPIAVEALPPDEAAALFWRHFEPTRPTAQSRRTGSEHPEVYDLIASFDHHTLLIEMLGKIGREAGYTRAELLRHVREMTLREEKWQILVGTGQSGRTHRMNKQTLKTYLAHLFREIKTLSEEDTGLLRRICVLPNRGYSTEQIAKLLKLEGDAVFELRKQLARLDQRGIPLQDAAQRGYWRLHPLFREVCLDQLVPFKAENLRPLPKVVGDMVGITTETKNWQEQFDNREFADELLLHLGNDKTPDTALLQNQLGLCYKQSGQYQKAKILFEKALTSDLENFDEKDERVAASRSNLAGVLQDLGDFSSAREQLELALTSDLKNFGQKHLKVARNRSNLACVLQDLGDLSGARNQSILALTIIEDLMGINHTNVAIIRSNLATVLQNLGDLSGARDHLELALTSDLQNLGEKHPNVAVRRSNLAGVLQDLGDFSGARKQLELALASDLKNFGEKHPKIGIRKNNLAYLFEKLDNHKQAIKLWQGALAIWREALPEGHPSIISVEQELRKRGIDV